MDGAHQQASVSIEGHAMGLNGRALKIQAVKRIARKICAYPFYESNVLGDFWYDKYEIPISRGLKKIRESLLYAQ